MHEGAWSELLKALDEDPRQAAKRLQALIDKLVRIFEWRGCREAGDAAFEVIDRVSQKLSQGVELTTSIERYASGFVNPIFHEYLRRQKKEQEMLEELPKVMEAEEAGDDREGHLICLDHCMEQSLAGDERDLLLEFHAYDGADRIKTRRKMAEARGKTVNALRIETHRLRKRLRGCVETCLREE